MSGFETSSIISYKLDSDKKLTLYRFCVFPQIRVIPDETRGSLSYQFDSVDLCFASGLKTEKIEFNGLLTFYRTAEGVEIKHMVSPAYDKKALVERIELKMILSKPVLFLSETIYFLLYKY